MKCLLLESLDLATSKAEMVAILPPENIYIKVAKSIGHYLWYMEAGVGDWSR